jgi:hypothetical protein
MYLKNISIEKLKPMNCLTKVFCKQTLMNIVKKDYYNQKVPILERKHCKNM